MFPSLTELCSKNIIEYNIKPIGISKLIKRHVLNTWKKKVNDKMFKMSLVYNKVFIPYKCQSYIQQKHYNGLEYIDIIDLTKNQLVIFNRKTTVC